MDCLRAQELVSETLDSTDVDPSELSEAKAHCRECPSCAAFVRAQLAVREAGLPLPPEDLPDRVMARVRAEAAQPPMPTSARSSMASVVRATQGAAPNANGAPVVEPARNWGDLLGRARDPRNRRAVVAWASAAAVLFIAAGIGAVAGVRTILVPQRAAEMTVMGTATEESFNYAGDAAVSGSAETAPGESRARHATSPAQSFITVGGEAYRLVGPVDEVDESSSVAKGSTSTALDTGGRAKTYDVIGAADGSVVYLEVDRDEWLSFGRVIRVYAGRAYALQSAPITAFGAWPTLPDGIDEPSAADGSPAFELEGADDAGVSVYRLRGATAEQGIAIAPGAPAGDPLASAPSWSWWAASE